MRLRASAAVVLLAVIAVGAVNPAAVCALWCFSAHTATPAHSRSSLLANVMPAHHHAGMHHAGSSVITPSIAAVRCLANCAGTTVAVARRSVSPEESATVASRPLRDDIYHLVVNHRETMLSDFLEPPGPDGPTVAILRV